MTARPAPVECNPGDRYGSWSGLVVYFWKLVNKSSCFSFFVLSLFLFLSNWQHYAHQIANNCQQWLLDCPIWRKWHSTLQIIILVSTCSAIEIKQKLANVCLEGALLARPRDSLYKQTNHARLNVSSPLCGLFCCLVFVWFLLYFSTTHCYSIRYTATGSSASLDKAFFIYGTSWDNHSKGGGRITSLAFLLPVFRNVWRADAAKMRT